MIQPNYNIVRKLVPASVSLSHVHNHNKSNLFGLHSCLQALLQHSAFQEACFSTCFGLLSYFGNVLPHVSGSVFGDFVGNSFKNMTSN